jgi:hypothetical protein
VVESEHRLSRSGILMRVQRLENGDIPVPTRSVAKKGSILRGTYMWAEEKA